jgi:chaperonin GroEL (HSP60 family)
VGSKSGTIVDAATAGVLDPGGVVKTAVRVAVSTTVQALTIGAIVRPRRPEDTSLGKRKRS